MTLTGEQAGVAGRDLRPDAKKSKKWLKVVPYKGSLPTSVPTDPLIYRFYELVSVYGTTFKELIHEEFGDGIMSAIDFKMDLQREPDPKGDRVIDHDVGQVPAVQDVLTLGYGWHVACERMPMHQSSRSIEMASKNPSSAALPSSARRQALRAGIAGALATPAVARAQAPSAGR